MSRSAGRRAPAAPLVVWVLILALSPVYVFESGLPQPDDVLMAALALLIMVTSGFRVPDGAKPALRVLIALVWYVCVVNIVWAVILGGSSGLYVAFRAVWYIFNLAAVLTLLTLYISYGRRVLEITAWVLGLSLILQSVALVLLPASVQRDVGLFNNPNQLAYSAIVAGSLVLLAVDQFRFPPAFSVAVFGAFALLVVRSASLAGLLGMAMLTILVLGRVVGSRPVTRVFALGVILVLGVPMGRVVVERMAPAAQELMVARRAFNDDLAIKLRARGYDRIANHPEYLVFGAGEGDFGRFRSYKQGVELHSSVGTILFSYGIVGLTLFAAWIVQVIRLAGFRVFLFSLPAFGYGLGHNGLRSTLFWILFAFFIALAFERRGAARTAGVAPAGSPRPPRWETVRRPRLGGGETPGESPA